MSARLALLVEFGIRPGAMQRFLPLMLANARASLADEPGCHRFDVLRPAGDPDAVTLYEIYDDDEAFRAHCASAHFLSFDRETADLVASKRVVELRFAGPADGPSDAGPSGTTT